jgi:hypothetical protein
MCLILLALLVIAAFILLAAIFVQSAVVLLPWTLPAAVLGSVFGFVSAKLIGRERLTGAAVGVVSSLILTLVIGFLSYKLTPPKAPLQKQGFEALLSPPVPTLQDLQQNFPVHLCISAVLSALVVAIMCYWLPSTSKERLDSGGTEPGALQNLDSDQEGSG